MVVIPSNPEKYYYQTTQVIMNLIKKKTWQPESLFIKVKLYCALVNYLSSQLQDKLPYNILRVDSNDSIFLGEEGFRQEGLTLIQQIFDAIVELAADSLEDQDKEVQANLSKSMTLLASTMAMNMEITPYVEKYIGKMTKRAEKSYMKSRPFITNAFLELSKKQVRSKIEKAHNYLE